MDCDEVIPVLQHAYKGDTENVIVSSNSRHKTK